MIYLDIKDFEVIGNTLSNHIYKVPNQYVDVFYKAQKYVISHEILYLISKVAYMCDMEFLIDSTHPKHVETKEWYSDRRHTNFQIVDNNNYSQSGYYRDIYNNKHLILILDPQRLNNEKMIYVFRT